MSDAEATGGQGTHSAGTVRIHMPQGGCEAESQFQLKPSRVSVDTAAFYFVAAFTDLFVYVDISLVILIRWGKKVALISYSLLGLFLWSQSYGLLPTSTLPLLPLLSLNSVLLNPFISSR